MNNTNTKKLEESIIATLAYYKALRTPLTLVQVGRYLVDRTVNSAQCPVDSEQKTVNSGQWTGNSGQCLVNNNQHEVEIKKNVYKNFTSNRKLGTGNLRRGDKQKNANTSTLSNIQEVLDKLVENKIVVKQKGLYWLSSRDAKPVTRVNTKKEIPGLKSRNPNVTSYELQVTSWLRFIQLEKIAQKKIDIARKALKIIRHVPFLKGVFICGSVARKVSRKNSDIDFLVVAKKKRVWMVRFIVTIIAFLIGKKTKDANTRIANYKSQITNENSRKNKFCLNHFRSSSNLKLEDSLQDLYSAQEYSRMINIYSGNRTDRKFFKKNKKWMKNILPNFNFTKLPLFTVGTRHGAYLQKPNGQNHKLKGRDHSTLEKMLSGKTGDIIERVLFFMQAKKITFGRKIKPANSRVIASDSVIMFHLNPRAPILLKKYEKILANTIG